MKRIKGFTLIELLVVVAIIGLLAMMLMPALTKAKETAKRASCKANLKAIASAYAMYCNENQDQFPFIPSGANAAKDDWIWNYVATTPDTSTGANRAISVAGTKYAFTALLFSLIRNEKQSPNTFICPSAEGDTADPNINVPSDAPGAVANTSMIAMDFSGYKAATDLSPTNPVAGASNHVSYSVQAPLYLNPGWSSGVSNAAQMNSLVIVADRTPDYQNNNATSYPWTAWIQNPTPLPKHYNSRNHLSEMQNLLFGDLHIGESTRPDCGTGSDCIYLPAGVTAPVANQPSQFYNGANFSDTDQHLSVDDSFLVGPIQGQ